jgi:hypothetical protein
MDRIRMVAFSVAPRDALPWSIKKYQKVTKIVYHGV